MELEDRIANIVGTTPLVRPGGSTQVAAGVAARFREIFLEAVPETLAELAEGQSDRGRLARTAHKLKGAAGFVGATRLWTLTADFEQSAERLTPDQLQYFLIVIKQVLGETENEMKRLLAGEA